MSSLRIKSDIKQILVVLLIVIFFVTLIFLNYVLFSTRAFIYEQNIKNQIPPIPGRFLWSLPISNESYCNFNYGLPNKLNFSESDLHFPPQEGTNSSYRVLYNVVEGDVEESVPKVTYVTHVTVDFVLFIPEIVRYWNGPISIAAFVPAQDAQIFFQKLFRICLCLADMSRVSIHLVFPVNFEPYLEEFTNSSHFQDCEVRNEFKDKFNRIEHDISYPINVGRNVAREAANTHFVMVTDIELIPSAHLAESFLEMMQFFRGIDPVTQVYVVPTFEVEIGYDMPLTKKNLLELVDAGAAVYFHKFLCPHCQKFPGIDAWVTKQERKSVEPFLSVKREYPFHRWEPIFIGTKLDPLYDEALSWEGLQDKMPQMLQMCLLNYRFVILDNAFLVHWPGIKGRHKRTNDGWRTPYIKRNTERYGHIIRQIASTTESSVNRKCRLQ
ncbi:beta-1,4-glucuronyltransferase 1-like [Coccinella septempunctata]|uniref:beta-1,4-glucuronyltransferase 1-like n=1 Tax=Coccinella septempunctata TaxID=41139 RepID=UPI001D0924B6|nr:beta-1,4-glucuronyltransferase 1-like [Coccinella septempunctata]